MKYLVDANVLSEPTRPEPDARVVEWLRANERDIAVDPVILGELRFGILILPIGRKRAALGRWSDSGAGRLHCLPWDADTGLRWAGLLARLRTSGKAMPIKDSLIAATAIVHAPDDCHAKSRRFRKRGRAARGSIPGLTHPLKLGDMHRSMLAAIYSLGWCKTLARSLLRPRGGL